MVARVKRRDGQDRPGRAMALTPTNVLQGLNVTAVENLAQAGDADELRG